MSCVPGEECIYSRDQTSLHFVIVIRIVLRSDYQVYCGKITHCIVLRITDHWAA